MSEFLLFTSAGDRFKLLRREYNNWNSHPKAIFDIYSVFYGDDENIFEELKNTSTYILRHKGAKFQNLLFAYKQNKELFKRYKYIFVLDNDIEINTLEINFMFNLAKEYDFHIIQPSLSSCERCRIDHWLMENTPFIFASKVSFIEVNMPLFKSDLLIAFLEYLIELDKPVLAGFGMDHLYLNFSNKIYQPKVNKTYAIIHGIHVINPKEENREIDNYEPLDKRRKHFYKLKLELNLESIVNREYEHAYECLPQLYEEYKQVLKYKESYPTKIPREFIVKKPRGWKELKFFEKIYYYATVLDHNYAKYVDKLEAKKIVSSLTDIKLAPVRKYMRTYDDLVFEDVREDCIIKTTHASGWNIIVNDDNRNNLEGIINKLKTFNTRFIHPHEKQYSYIEPRFYIEELIDDKYYGKNGIALVYMIRCIYGKAKCVNIKLGEKQNYYDLNWQPFYTQELPAFEKPKNLDKMIEYAEKLSKNFEFVRMDFYIDKNDDIYFSEFTFTPNAGTRVFTDEWEISLGKDWV